jgi:hypothetical protein
MRRRAGKPLETSSSPRPKHACGVGVHLRWKALSDLTPPWFVVLANTIQGGADLGAIAGAVNLLVPLPIRGCRRRWIGWERPGVQVGGTATRIGLLGSSDAPVFPTAAESTYGYWIVALGVMAESMGLPFPGETLLLLGGASAGAG